MTKDNSIYEEICDLDNLELAYKRARKGKTQKQYVVDFENDLNLNLKKLRIELLMMTYKPEPLKTFILRDPKTRKISKSAFRDRIVHHAICNIIEPEMDKHFINDSYANRINKGIMSAINRFDKFKRKVSKNNTKQFYVLKADIKQYFQNIDHDILRDILSKYISDDRLFWLINIILNNYNSGEAKKGMPLGNLTSQFFANVYLNELDQFVKHKLKIKYYIRYVDDFIIFDRSKDRLNTYKEVIDYFLINKLKIQLHPNKSKTLKITNGVNFLGFRIFYYHRLIRKKNISKFNRKYDRLKKQYIIDKIDKEKAVEKFEGWLAYVNNADSFKYRKKIASRFNRDFPFKETFKITSVKKHENFNHKLYNANLEFSKLKTLQLFKKGLQINQIAKSRGLKENTIWNHIAFLIEHHLIRLKEVISADKIKLIISQIKSHQESLKDIKSRLPNDINYNEINCGLANLKGKHRKKNIVYYSQWYQKINCYRKCYNDKEQRKICREKFQLLISEYNKDFTKKEFLDFFNNSCTICVLPDKEKKKFVSWYEFKKTVSSK